MICGWIFDSLVIVVIFTEVFAFKQMLRWLYFAGSVRKVGSLSSLTSVFSPFQLVLRGIKECLNVDV